MLLCPVCKIVLKNTLRSDVSIDFCPQCRGIWLDRNELDKIIERSAKRNSAAEGVSWRVRPQQSKTATRVYPLPPDESSQLYLEELFDDDD
jgi:uncharacterized protein